MINIYHKICTQEQLENATDSLLLAVTREEANNADNF